MAAATAIKEDWSPALLTGRSASHVVDSPELGCRLHPAAAQALLRLRAAAAGDGIGLQALSAFRDFDRQVLIWNAKFRGERPLLDRHGQPLDGASLGPAERITAILLWSALPGASRHHWGTEVDVIDRACLAPGARAELVRADYAPDGCFAGLDAWLSRHAADFGFFRPYDLDRGGVQPEPWHLSFAPLAVPALDALTIEVLAGALQFADIDGREFILPRLPELHACYVRAVSRPPARALAAPRLGLDAWSAGTTPAVR
jgi:LAS superfamily LD-carboxypeptidase LdcB